MSRGSIKGAANYTVIAIVTIVAILILALIFKEEEKPSTKLGRAVEDVADGLNDAANELKPESEKTVGDKIGDALEDAGDNLKDNN